MRSTSSGSAAPGLSAIARLMAQQGIRVSGSDANESAVVEALRSEGISASSATTPRTSRESTP